VRCCRLRRALGNLLCALASVPSLTAQLEPPSTGGAVALAHELRMLGHYQRVLMIGAHPDDEDTELLTVLARSMGAEAAYLSLNRGEGGQNLIGSELGEALGLLRTEELLAARRLDGARQFFTRAYDFGYSKSLEETWRHWPRDSILKDVVRVMRRFRPQIVVSVFSGTPRDGHGQHQAAGWSAREGFDAAGDSTRFPELAGEGLAPWSPRKLYQSTRFDTLATTLVLEGGVLDPAVGRSYHQIAMAGRSLHRSQDMGMLQRIGPSKVRLRLVEDRTGAGGGGLWDGIDTTLAGMAAAAASAGGSVQRAVWDSVAASVAAARARPEPAALADALDRFARAIAGGGSGPISVGRPSPEQWDQVTRLERALRLASGVLCDAVADDDRIVPGQVVVVNATCWNPGDRPVSIPLVVVRSSASRSRLMQSAAGATVPPGGVATWTLELETPYAAAPTQPYYLARPRDGDLYLWPDGAPELTGSPFGEPLLMAEFGSMVEPREVAFRYRDQALGERRRPVTVVPRIDVKLDPDTLVWAARPAAPKRFSVALRHGARDTTAGEVWLELPPGWPRITPQQFTLVHEDQEIVVDFEVRPPPALAPGSVEVHAVAADASGREYAAGVFTMDYPHVRPRAYVGPAAAAVRVAPLALPKLARVGYVRGAADRVPEALRSVGVPVELLDARALERGDLARYDAIVLGPRAYETEPVLGRQNGRLLAYVRRGGLLIVQYQQHDFFSQGYAPYPLTVGGQPLVLDDSAPGATARPRRPVSHDRVTDERAPVTPVARGHAAFRTPNAIGAADWAGWVQERGLYFARTWDPAYTPLVETHDDREPPLEGGLLVARVGTGTYVYTGLSFFRQLPAGVPGAYRLFANLLALGRVSGS
jgi:LmbE family N-acetylglucosaminyl deacetylase